MSNPNNSRAATAVVGGAASERERYCRKHFPDAEYDGKVPCDDAHLLHFDLDLLLSHCECFDAVKRERLEQIYQKIRYNLKSGRPGYWKNNKEWNDYDKIGALVAMSVYDRADEFCDCGFNGFSCGDRLLCLRCCYNLLAEPALDEFGHALYEDQECLFIVMTLSREPDEKKRLIFCDLTKSVMQQVKAEGLAAGEVPGQATGAPTPLHRTLRYGIPAMEPLDADEARRYFDIYGEVIHESTGSGRGKLFSGAFGGPELAVNFMPLEVLPHANYVVWSSGSCADDARRLRQAIRKKLRARRNLTPGLYPKVAVYRIKTKADYHAVIKYMFKPVDVAAAYETAAARAIEFPRQALQALNTELHEFFCSNLKLCMHDVKRMNRYGRCSPAHEGYFGCVTAKRKQRRRKDAKRRIKRQREDAKIRRRFPAYQPHRRGITRREREENQRIRSTFNRELRGEFEPALVPRRWLRRPTRPKPKSARSSDTGRHGQHRQPSHPLPGTTNDLQVSAEAVPG